MRTNFGRMAPLMSLAAATLFHGGASGIAQGRPFSLRQPAEEQALRKKPNAAEVKSAKAIVAQRKAETDRKNILQQQKDQDLMKQNINSAGAAGVMPLVAVLGRHFISHLSSAR